MLDTKGELTKPTELLPSQSVCKRRKQILIGLTGIGTTEIWHEGVSGERGIRSVTPNRVREDLLVYLCTDYEGVMGGDSFR